MNHFFAYLFRMKHIKRWGLMRNTQEDNLEQHSLEVAALAHALALIRRDILHQPCDPEHIAAVAMYHDTPEILTGDLPTPVKYMSPDLLGAYRQIEAGAKEKLLAMLPDELRPSYRALYEAEEDPAVKPLVKAADKLAAYIKCMEELKSGNGEFRRAAEQTRDALRGMNLPELDYFIVHFLPSFELTIHEMSPL